MDTTVVDEPLARGFGRDAAFWFVLAGLFGTPLLFWQLKRLEGTFLRWSPLFPISLAVACLSWIYLVSAVVPEPYLDEVFHIPQAQKYCEGRFREWDDKITTPPGLYLLSLIVPGVVVYGSSAAPYVCDARNLRATSGIALTFLAYYALHCRHEIEARLFEAHAKTKLRSYSQYSLHTAFNIALFPLLFFFSGLYYTDIASTAVVLLAYGGHLERVGHDRSSILSDLTTIFTGIMTLFMRQTNVFWVVVYMGGLEAVHAIKTLRPERVDQPVMNTLAEQLQYYLWRYSLGDIHDPPLHDIWPDDMLFCIISLGIAAICNPIRVIRQIWPYITVLGLFGTFVLWNGGVVLGDKSNHVATIHLTQMLYIWGFFGFFSIPLLVPYALPIVNFATRVYNVLTSQKPASPRPAPSSDKGSKQHPNQSSTKPQPKLMEASKSRVDNTSWPLRIAAMFFKASFWPAYLVTTIFTSFIIVNRNTIIHPFTLADNRHYMFYIFRYTILRSSLIRYMLILPYTLSRWMIWGTMAGCSRWFFMTQTDECSAYYTGKQAPPYLSHPFFIRRHGGTPRQTDAEFPTEIRVEGKEVEAAKQRSLQGHIDQDPLYVSVEPASTSTGLIFLLATTLSLITAPLVEPRYFIIPWVMWRLLVPGWRLHDHETQDNVVDKALRSSWGWLLRPFRRYDLRLILETGWFIAINVVTGYIFLRKPYLWRAEDGTVLDDGRLQRFMW
ncbi:DIE2/ALG10 family-domain-containing protein [Thelonectria olida]|uniref:Dol-P-Glc:Glc(2)Man(9)GlcNAc(2)-PP-Dol alpha-1,2-glucosyltransferase n=1 Tax=Thelonectria olida TaxID=1576542 RepID=A0A9P9AUF4_9HYPO|nr:DIE2/ALG10 family-domain-containing protein [Thelonectria olida]